MQAHLRTPRVGAAGPAKPAVVLFAAVTAIALLFVAEMAAPRALTLGTAVLVPVLVSCFLLEKRWAATVLGLAVLSRIVAALVGDTTVALVALEVTSYIGCAAIALVYTRRDQPLPARTPLADVLPPRPEPHISPATLEACGLTEREREVLDMSIHGLTAKQIGERLFIGRRTVETHLGRAREKLGVRTKRELIALSYDGRDPAQSASGVPRTR